MINIFGANSVDENEIHIHNLNRLIFINKSLFEILY